MLAVQPVKLTIQARLVRAGKVTTLSHELRRYIPFTFLRNNQIRSSFPNTHTHAHIFMWQWRQQLCTYIHNRPAGQQVVTFSAELIES